MEIKAQGDINRLGLFNWVMMIDRDPMIGVIIHIRDGVFGGIYGTANYMEAFEVFDIAGITVSDTIFVEPIW